ncbi:MAG: hypothetical protein WEB60_09690 [Terrimicrobiaceae bacterium]
MNTKYQPPLGQRLPATLLDLNGLPLSCGEAFLHAEIKRGSFFQISPCLKGNALQRVEAFQFNGEHRINIADIEKCQVDGPVHLSFRVV